MNSMVLKLQFFVTVSFNVGDVIPSSMQDTQAGSSRRRFKEEEMSPKFRIVNRERETKKVILDFLNN